MTLIVAEALAERKVCESAALASPALHGFEVVVGAVMLFEPDSLAGVFGKHGVFAGEDGFDIDDEVRLYDAAFAIGAFGGVHEIEMGDVIERRRGLGGVGAVVRRRCGEAGIAHEGADGFVIAVVVRRAMR